MNNQNNRIPENANTVRNGFQPVNSFFFPGLRSDIRRGRAIIHGANHSNAVKPTITNVVRQPQRSSIHGTSNPSTTNPVRVPKSNTPAGSPRSPREKSKLTIFDPPGR